MQEELKCPFCNLEADRKIIMNDQYCVAFLDKYPVSPGHTLIIPKIHESNFFNLSEQWQDILIFDVNCVKQILDEKYHPDGYNIGINIGDAAGQTVPHIHIHIIPRYKGDVENPRGGVRGVIPSKQSY